MTIRCLTSGKEGDARVVGEFGEGEAGHVYGIRFLDPQLDLWGVAFPSVNESDVALGRVLLQCPGCKNREATYLDEFELEFLEAKR